MIVKHIAKNQFDIFFDTGWENWARFTIENKSLKQTAGVSIPKNIQTFLEKRYIK